MDLSIAIFVIGILMSIIAWLGQKILNQILTELQSLRRDVEKLTEGHVKARSMIQTLPCRTEIKPCFHLQGVK